MPQAPKGKSKDQNQEKLRANKRAWSDATSALIANIIAFKRGLNGRGDAKVGLPPSNIKEPLPGEIGSFLNQLSGEFQKIVADAESIISEQEQYSRTRRKKQPKQQKQAPMAQNTTQQPVKEETVAPAQPDIDNTLSRLGSASIEELEKIASSKLTRLWQYMTAIFSTKDFNRQRLGLMSRSVDLYRGLLDVENDILNLKISSIPEAVSKYRKFRDDFNILTGIFQGVMEMVANKAGIKPANEEKIEEQPKEKQQATQQSPIEEQQEVVNEVPQTDNEIERIKKDLHLIFNAGLGGTVVMPLNNAIDEYNKETDTNVQSLMKDRIIEAYKNLIRSIVNDVQKKYGPATINNLQDIITLIRKNKTTASLMDEDLIKFAHNSITRYLKKQLVKAIPFNETANIRLEVVSNIDSMKKILKRLINTFHDDLSIHEAKILIEQLDKEIKAAKRPIHILNTFYMRDLFSKNKNIKHPPGSNDEMFDTLMKRKVKKDLLEDF
jgi:hypothetical protein